MEKTLEEAARRSNTVFWVVQNDRSGEEATVLGAFMAPPWLPLESLAELEEWWRDKNPYGKAEEFIIWLCTVHTCTPITVQVYPFG